MLYVPPPKHFSLLTEEEKHKAIEDWYSSDTGMSLCQWLGISKKEYLKWVETGEIKTKRRKPY